MRYHNALLKRFKTRVDNHLRLDNTKISSMEEMLSDIETPLIADNTFQIIKPYMKWIMSRYLSSGIHYEDILSRTVPSLLKYDALKKKKILCNHDINKIKTLMELEDIVDQFDDLKSRSELKEEETQRFFDTEQAELIYNTDEHKIIIPKTEEAAQYFGKNTKWCTSAEKYNAFKSYHDQGPLYIILHKPTNRRWQFHFETTSYMDERDKRIDFFEFKDEHKIIVDFLVSKNIPDDMFVLFSSMTREEMTIMLDEKVAEFRKKYPKN